jgi:hypothetical protein
MEKKDETASLRGSRARGRIAQGARGRGKSPSPKSKQNPRNNSPEPRGRGRVQDDRMARRNYQRPIQRRGRGMGAPRYRNRMAQSRMRYQQRRQRRRFPRRRFFGMRGRMNFGRRNIFISGLPKMVDQYKLMDMLRKEGRVLRCTLLKDRFGGSRGIAFAAIQNPRDAWKIIQKYNGYKVNNNQIFVAYKREPRRYGYFTRYRNRFGNNRSFNNYRRFNQRQPLNRSFGNNRMRGRFRRGGRMRQ